MTKMFKVWWPDRGHTQDDAKIVKSYDHESAAANWADWYDAQYGDYCIVGGEEASVMVLYEGDDSPVCVVVSGYSERAYYGNIRIGGV